MEIRTLALKTPEGQPFTMWIYQHDQFTLFPDDRQWPLALIFPGGGFAGYSEREVEAVALKFIAKGYQAAVVKYNLTSDGPFYPTAATIGLAALSYVKRHAQELNADSDHVVVSGFSAGGHLVAVMTALGAQSEFLNNHGFEETKLVPFAQILSYPVIDLTMGFPTSQHEMMAVTTDESYWHAQELVTSQTPPTFIWATRTDELVPVVNSLVYLAALGEHNVPFESHIYAAGVHGLAFGDLADSRYHHPEDVVPRVQNWFPMALGWLRTLYASRNSTEI
ncbi:alpha/beta hydrolase [Lactiplantibacillus plantarum]|uniref:alpha/beta hydrolase n=1 Tax=Lactiplantibacillus TaxID=2767842 RepID=UPI0006A5D997|nr:MULTISPECIES: alpha/beta hydrolase [Lactiplantibacillus]MDN6022392.1 alpha/beta hydrolase [Lactobacillus sp.]ASD31138.1 alpha/beta hydrolase [Lactiplantibacillus plantarum]AUH38505.1 alpha/beta hydrolase [Lactiplantibacillus plantarum]AXI14004.1 alpha/beta hydrolase [Lactiplantibacillus plantarum]KOE72195.1 lipase [Lactiplantibacillus plantarum]